MSRPTLPKVLSAVAIAAFVVCALFGVAFLAKAGFARPGTRGGRAVQKPVRLSARSRLTRAAIARGPSAVPCDHRFGADATWSHSSDGIRKSTAFFPEMLAFAYGAGFTVFESADTWDRVPLAARSAAYRTGRLSPSLYFHGDEGGEPLLSAESAWFHRQFGRWPAALSYSHGIDDERDVVAKYVFGARNSDYDNATSYGDSTQRASEHLGTPATDFTREHISSMPSSTRFFDMWDWRKSRSGEPNPLSVKSAEQVVDASVEVAEDAIADRGWYSDFAHWSGPSGTFLSSFVGAHMRALEATDALVAKVPYDVALQHAFLRQSARCSLEPRGDSAVELKVAWRYPYDGPPLRSISIPLSVRVDLAGTPLEGRQVAARGDAGIRRVSDDLYIVEVPFVATGSRVTLTKTHDPAYISLKPPKVTLERSGSSLEFRTDRPTKAVLFLASSDTTNALAADVVWRSRRSATTHRVDLGRRQGALGGNVTLFSYSPERLSLFLGVVDDVGNSELTRVADGDRATRLRISSPQRTSDASESAIFGRLLSGDAVPLPGRKVVAQERKGQAWVTVGDCEAVRGESGVYRAVVRPTKPGVTRYRFHYYGEKLYDSCSSSSESIRQ
ncbi:MAG: hypothetical protein HY876_02085 [Coriobacteriales bacterium]|nr:hypothetical protein [Coriobacteriales bacterium]